MASLSKSTSFLGIDFNASSVKVVELRNDNGRSRLVTYGYYDRPLDLPGPETVPDSQLSAVIRQVCAQAKVTGTKVISALPAFSVFSSILNLPAMAKKDLGGAVQWEAKKVIPLPLQDMILDWKILEENVTAPDGPATAETTPPPADGKRGTIAPASGKKYTKILLTAAPKDLVKRYINVFKGAGLNLLSLDTESFAVIRSLVGNDKSGLMIVDIGSVVTTISIVMNGIPMLNRSIDVGGLTITKAIGNSLNITSARAEQFKYDIGMNPQQSGQGSVPKTIETTLTPILDEIRYSLNLYRTQGQKQIEKIILTGGSSLLGNLPNYIADAVQLKVYRGDAWARIVYPEELKPVLDEIGPRFAVAVGLAMRNIV